MSLSPPAAIRGFPILASSLVILVVLSTLCVPDFPGRWRFPIAYGVVVSGAISVVGFLLLRRARAASNRMFIKLVLGGLVGRLFAALVAVVAGIALLGLEPVVLVVACLGSYVVFSIFEYTSLFKEFNR